MPFSDSLLARHAAFHLILIFLLFIPQVEDGGVVLHLADPPSPPLLLDLLLPGHGGRRDRGRQSDLGGVHGGRGAVGGRRAGERGRRGGGAVGVVAAGQVDGREGAAVVGGRRRGGGRDEEGGVLVVVVEVVGLGLKASRLVTVSKFEGRSLISLP